MLIWQFEHAPEHCTGLLKNAGKPGSYVTIDLWRTTEAFAAFGSKHGEAVPRLDPACEGLTNDEIWIGAFDTQFVQPKPNPKLNTKARGGD